MTFNQDINTKALNIIKEQEQIKDYLRNCKRANICSKCGEILIERSYPDLSKIEYNNDISSIKECPKDKTHPSFREYYDDDYDN